MNDPPNHRMRAQAIHFLVNHLLPKPFGRVTKVLENTCVQIVRRLSNVLVVTPGEAAVIYYMGYQGEVEKGNHRGIEAALAEERPLFPFPPRCT